MSRRPDESMRILETIRENAVDPGYAAVARRGRPPVKRPLLVLAVFVVAGAMFAVSAKLNASTAASLTTEREELITRITEAQTRQNELTNQAKALTSEVGTLRDQIANQATSDEIAALEPAAAGSRLRGPGVVIVVDDAPTEKADSQVTDQDLRQLVNGLWQGGAEAIAINGHRLSSRTSIRNAGSAITVDYASLVRPYRVEAIGDPKKLPARFAQTSGASWWNFLQGNYGILYTLTPAEDLDLGPDPGLGLTFAEARK